MKKGIRCLRLFAGTYMPGAGQRSEHRCTPRFATTRYTSPTDIWLHCDCRRVGRRDAAYVGGAEAWGVSEMQSQRRPVGPTPNPQGHAMPVPPPLARGVLSLNACRCVPGPQPVHTARTVRTPTRQQRKRRCMPCRCMPNPPLATGNRTRHVCAADNLQTRCKQQAPESPLKQYPETVQKLGKCPPSRASEDALRRTKCANWPAMRTGLTSRVVSQSLPDFHRVCWRHVGRTI